MHDFCVVFIYYFTQIGGKKQKKSIINAGTEDKFVNFNNLQ